MNKSFFSNINKNEIKEIILYDKLIIIIISNNYFILL